MTETSSSSAITKAVIPAAGLGTRFLPASKAVPKEMLPVVDRPAIQYVVEEAAAAGLTDVLMVTGRGKGAIENHFDTAFEVQARLEKKGDAKKLAALTEPEGKATLHYVRQGEAKGLGHAVHCAKMHVGNEPFAVLLGDDLIDPRDPLLTTMVRVQQERGGSVIGLLEVPREQISLYGCATPAGELEGDVVPLSGLVEKPPVESAPSNLAIIGRYVLHPAVFEVLENTPPGRGDEIQLTDALQTLATMPASEGGGVHGVVFRGRRYDTGAKLDYLQAVIRLACEREDLGPDLMPWLKDFVAGGFANTPGA